MIRKWTTPSQEFIVPGIDLTNKDVYVTFSQDDTVSTFDGEHISVEYDGTDTTITVPLAQSDTGALAEGIVAVQVNYLDGGERKATDIAYIKVGKNLVNSVLPIEDTP